jgi:hypothetical protein
MIHYFLFYDSRNRLMAKDKMTLEEYRQCSNYYRDAAYVVEVNLEDYKKARVI